MKAGDEMTTLDELAARAAITDVLHRYARAMDRMDADLALSCWHPGGTDDHAPLFAGTAEGFVAWLWPVHAAMVATRHVISNILIVVDGDRAASESYWTVTLRMTADDGTLHDMFGQGRYVDTFERIDGVWAIRHRQSLHDWDRIDPVGPRMGEADAPIAVTPNNPEVAAKPVARDRSDHSYAVLTFKEPVR
ncbi:nuclear transport factor 2 family protein [Sphingomonas profundi]|uniref:nuclear transport factor 2 family protein n=1 Tax=Alterirhizorhabdus profundi TaxID=2681549 RepID=UPI0012E92868|nr:nuclear transport factor 2 family protein [Sphingomonas profundi]